MGTYLTLPLLGRAPVGGIQAKIRAAYEAGITEVIVPADNGNEAFNVPDYIKEAVKITLVDSIDQVLGIALIE